MTGREPIKNKPVPLETNEGKEKRQQTSMVMSAASNVVPVRKEHNADFEELLLRNLLNEVLRNDEREHDNRVRRNLLNEDQAKLKRF